jgi:hypothetical protein
MLGPLICCKGTPGAERLCAREYWRFNPDNQCDNVIKNYCLSNSSDPICACENSKTGLPHCQDSACQKTGYINKNLSKIPCPNIINCNQEMSNIEVQKGGKANLNQLQICSDDQQIKKLLEEKGEQGIIEALDKIHTVPETTNWMIYVFIFVLIIIMLVAYKVKTTKNTKPRFVN